MLVSIHVIACMLCLDVRSYVTTMIRMQNQEIPESLYGGRASVIAP